MLPFSLRSYRRLAAEAEARRVPAMDVPDAVSESR
jgi:hypothetical protein